MTEASYQTKIMRALESMGGKAVNGTYTKVGEADIQGGYPYDDRLYYIAIEVKTEYDYNRVMGALVEDDNGLFDIINMKALKKHEPMQVHKINEVRKKGGIALFAFNIDQVIRYAEETIESH